MSDMRNARQIGAELRPPVGEAALRARKAVARSRGFGIASAMLAALIALGVVLNSPTTDPLDYLPFVVAAVVLVLPLGIVGLVFGCSALLRARRAGVSTTGAVVAIALSGSGAAIGLGIRLWAETF